jgi:hypothetical protein
MELVVFGPSAPIVVLAMAMAHPLVVGVVIAPVLLFGLLGYHGNGSFWPAPPLRLNRPVTPAKHAETIRYVEKMTTRNPVSDLGRALAIMAILAAGLAAALAPMYYFTGYY